MGAVFWIDKGDVRRVSGVADVYFGQYMLEKSLETLPKSVLLSEPAEVKRYSIKRRAKTSGYRTGSKKHV